MQSQGKRAFQSQGDKNTAVGTALWQTYGVHVERTSGDLIRCAKDQAGMRSGITVQTVKQSGSGKRGSGKVPKPSGGGEAEKSYLSASFALCAGLTYIDRIIEMNGKDGEKVIYDRYSELGDIYDAKIAALNQKIFDERAANNSNETLISQWEQERDDLIEDKNQAKGMVFTPVYGPVSGDLIAELSETVRMYYGSEEQPTDSAEASWYDDGVSADRGITKIVFSNYGPLESGTTFKFVLRNGYTTLRSVVEHRLKLANIPDSRIHLNSISNFGTPISWFVPDRQPARNLAEQVAAVDFHDLHFLATAQGCVFTDMSRSAPAYVTLTDAELGAYDNTGNSGQPPSSISVNLQSDEARPQSVSVGYFNTDDNDKATESIVHWPFAIGEPQNISLPAYGAPQPFIDFNEAVMRELQVAAGTIQVSLMPKYSYVCPGSVLDIPEPTPTNPNGRKYLRVVNQSIAPAGVISCDCSVYDPTAYQSLPDVPRVITPPPAIIDYGRPSVTFIDSVCIEDEMVPQGVLLAAAYMPDDRSWGGASLVSTGGVWDETLLGTEATVGVLLNTTSYTREETTAFVAGKTMRVELYNGSFTSCSQADAYNRVNLINVGGVYVSFTTATQIATNTWDLTGLLFGRFGSDFLTTIPAGAKVVLMTDASGNLQPSLTAVPVDRRYKGTSLGYTVANARVENRVTSGAVTFAANNLRALAPSAWVSLGYDDAAPGSEGLRLRFMARTRYPFADEEQISAGLPMRWSDPFNFTVALNGASPSVGGVAQNIGTDGEIIIEYSRELLLDYFGYVPTTLSGTITNNNELGAGFPRAFSVSI